MHLEELPRGKQCLCGKPVRPVRRDERNEDDEPGVAHELADLRHAADILSTVLRGEAQILVEARPDVVAVEDIRVNAQSVEPTDGRIGNARLAGTRQPGESHDLALMPHEPNSRLVVDVI